MRPSAGEPGRSATSPAAPRRLPRLRTVLTFGAAFVIITLVLFEGSRLTSRVVLPAAGPIAGLAIMTVTALLMGPLFFSSPLMWLRLWAQAAAGPLEPSWLTTVDVVGPFFVYGAIHGAFVGAGLTRRSMARAIARRYLVTFLVVAVVGVALAMVVMAVDS